MSLTINKTYTPLQETHHRTWGVDTREIPQDRGVGSVFKGRRTDASGSCHISDIRAKSMAAEPMETKRHQFASSRVGCCIGPKHHIILYFWFSFQYLVLFSFSNTNNENFLNSFWITKSGAKNSLLKVTCSRGSGRSKKWQGKYETKYLVITENMI